MDLRALFATNERGRLTGSAPHLHIIRARDTVLCRCHEEVPDQIVTATGRLASRPRGRPSQWAEEYAEYLEVFAAFGPPRTIRAGPLYAFPDSEAPKGGAIKIDARNADLLRGGLEEWLPDVQKGLPMSAVLVEGRGVSVCASVPVSVRVHHAGVETIPAFRGRGFAAEAVDHWQRTVKDAGVLPVYATTFDNLPSQRLARRLGLELFASEFSVRCAIG